jgi:hypothetical protein
MCTLNLSNRQTDETPTDDPPPPGTNKHLADAEISLTRVHSAQQQRRWWDVQADRSDQIDIYAHGQAYVNNKETAAK